MFRHLRFTITPQATRNLILGCLAIVQFLTTVGIPLPQVLVNSIQQARGASACQTGRCGCAVPVSIQPTCCCDSGSAAPTLPPKSCCNTPNPTTLKSLCCASPTTEPNPEPEPTFRVVWVNIADVHTCRGSSQHPPGILANTEPAIPPVESPVLLESPLFAGLMPVAEPHLLERSELPPVPPPKLG